MIVDNDYYEETFYSITNISIAYQMRAKKSNFWSFGLVIHDGLYIDEQYGWGNWEYTRDTRIFPVIGWDIRF